QNAEGQCGSELPNPIITPMKYRQLGIGALEGNQKSPVQINLDKCKYIVTGDHYSMAVNNENK
ncbi:32455_t:CDS:2, partial [Gigaspora margarita]